MKFASIAEARAFLLEAGAECVDPKRYIYRTERASYLQLKKNGLLDVEVVAYRWDRQFIEDQGIIIA